MTTRSGIENVLPQLLLGHLKGRGLEMAEGKEEFHARHARELGCPAGRQLPQFEQLDGPKHLEVLAEGLRIRLQADQCFFRDLQPDRAHEISSESVQVYYGPGAFLLTQGPWQQIGPHCLRPFRALDWLGARSWG